MIEANYISETNKRLVDLGIDASVRARRRIVRRVCVVYTAQRGLTDFSTHL